MTVRRTVKPGTYRETEAQWQAAVVDLAKLRGWLVHHQRPARTADGGWRSAIVGDAGFPDLVLARSGRLILAELKSETGRTTLGQRTWLAALEVVAAGGPGNVEVHVWRPRDWRQVDDALR